MTTGPSLEITTPWMAIEAEREGLHVAWGDHETWLNERYGWLSLTREQQHATPDGSRFKEIDQRFEEIGAKQMVLFEALPTSPAADVSVVIANPSLAATILLPEDYPGVHGLITGADRDLKILAAIP